MGEKYDVAVLGAGIVGVSAAIHLRRAGLAVALIDRKAPGEETSFGNAGIIQREGVHPYIFPRSATKLLAYALNRRVEAHLQWSSLPHVAGFLWRYFLASSPAGARKTFDANTGLFAECLTSHGELIEASGASNLIAKGGWIAAFRKTASLKAVAPQLAELRELGLDAAEISSASLAELEPNLNGSVLDGAVHYRDPWTVSDPGALVKAYAGLLEREGGVVLQRQITTPARSGAGWSVAGIEADRIVVALGPWSKPLMDAMGLRLPMGVKRGYHRHYKPQGNAVLSRPVVDDDNGFVIAPMARGIRLTSGAEFARHDAPPMPVQIAKAEPLARQLFPLAGPVEDTPWMGARPVFPDMRPVIGEAPGLPGVWLDFGHAHHGLTLGPASGKLLAAMMTDGEPFIDPAPFSPARFTRT